MYKFIAFLYTTNVLAEREIKKIIPYTIDQKISRNKFNQGDTRPVLRKL